MKIKLWVVLKTELKTKKSYHPVLGKFRLCEGGLDIPLGKRFQETIVIAIKNLFPSMLFLFSHCLSNLLETSYN